MSRVLVVTSGALFVRGGHLVIAEETCAALRRAGHEAEVFVTPQNRFGRQLSAYCQPCTRAAARQAQRRRRKDPAAAEGLLAVNALAPDDRLAPLDLAGLNARRDVYRVSEPQDLRGLVMLAACAYLPMLIFGPPAYPVDWGHATLLVLIGSTVAGSLPSVRATTTHAQSTRTDPAVRPGPVWAVVHTGAPPARVAAATGRVVVKA